MVKRVTVAILLGLIPLILSCSSQQTKSSSLVLSVSNESDSLVVVDYEVLDQPYRKNYQQGRYQIHLMDERGSVIQKISFDNLSFGDVAEGQFQLVVPVKPLFDQLALYRLDGSSGHYQLKDKRPLLSWQLPDKLRESIIEEQKKHKN